MGIVLQFLQVRPRCSTAVDAAHAMSNGSRVQSTGMRRGLIGLDSTQEREGIEEQEQEKEKEMKDRNERSGEVRREQVMYEEIMSVVPSLCWRCIYPCQ